MSARAEERRHRQIFRRAHAGHTGCAEDEWLSEPCRGPDGRQVDRPLVWSRRNGPWRQVDVLLVGAAPGNAGGMGSGGMGAHATRIPFGGDIAGANLDHLLDAAGLDRNHTFIVAALNCLPDRGGGEPSAAELRRSVGDHPSSLHLLRDTLLAAGPRLVVLLGNVALRTTVAAARLADLPRLSLPGLARLESAGAVRGRSMGWPAGFEPDGAFEEAWSAAWGRPRPRLLWLLHPSAQNMSPHARVGTLFHSRMLETRDALVEAVRSLAASRGRTGGSVPSEMGGSVPSDLDGGQAPHGGIYDLVEWRHAIGPRHAELRDLWRSKGA